jgi:hypothetical protein
MKDFFLNVSRYPRYFITFVLGILYSVFEWLRPLAKNRLAAAALLGFFVTLLVFLGLTLKAMMGMGSFTVPEYPLVN